MSPIFLALDGMGFPDIDASFAAITSERVACDFEWAFDYESWRKTENLLEGWHL